MGIIKVEDKDKHFVLDWHEEFGWKKDPFHIALFEPINKYVAGFEDEIIKINSFIIKKETFGALTGEPGSGKTTLLKLIQVDLKKYLNKLIVLYADLDKVKTDKQILTTLTKHLMTTWERFFKKPEDVTGPDIYKFINERLKERRIVLLLDNVSCISENLKLLFKNLLQCPVQYIVADTKENIESSGIKTLFPQDSLDIELLGLEADDAYTMIEKRITSVGGNGVYPLDSDMIKAICASNRNPSAILKQAYEVSLKHSLWHVQSKRLSTDDDEDEYAEDVSDKIQYEVEEPQSIEPLLKVEEPIEEEPEQYHGPIKNTPQPIAEQRTINIEQPQYTQKNIISRPREEKEVKIKNIPPASYNTKEYNTKEEKPNDKPVDVRTKEFEDILREIEF